MGTWDISIKGNDTFQDIYCSFNDYYNNGGKPKEISKIILKSLKEYFEDIDDSNNAYFALALAQWETKSLDPKIYKKVKEIVQTGNVIDRWKSLGADKTSLIKREKLLQKLLIKLGTEKNKSKRRIKSKLEFQINSLIDLVSPDGSKTFSLKESLTNGNYDYTAGSIDWKNHGDCFLWYKGQNKNIKAKWLNNYTLEITYEKDMIFTKKNTTCFHGEFVLSENSNKPIYYSNEVKIKYICF